ncbi:MAG: hypothetical protein MZV70_46070 [Desulfobacterales bacterium]|nr:hypothetical protein [Desulfobacterales bacterium]
MPKIDGDKLIQIVRSMPPPEGLLPGDRFGRGGRDRLQFPGDRRRLLRGQGPLQRHGRELPRRHPGFRGAARAGGAETGGRPRARLRPPAHPGAALAQPAPGDDPRKHGRGHPRSVRRAGSSTPTPPPSPCSGFPRRSC